MTEQEKRESVIKEFKDNYRPYSPGYAHVLVRNWAVQDAIDLLKSQELITGETSDGYHTFNELYHHRAVLFSVIVNNYKDLAWKSVRHHDGTMYDGMFIVGIDTPDGQATYHYDINPYWDMFKCRVREFAPEWDGHTPAQAIERISKLKAQEPRVMTLEEVMATPKDVAIWQEIKDDPDYKYEISPIAEPSEITIDCNDDWFNLEPKEPLIGIRFANEGYMPKETYGATWRCWTSRPDDKRRAETPWN